MSGSRRVLAVAAVAVACSIAPGPAQAAVVLTEFGTPTAASAPAQVAVARDRNVWFTESATDAVGQLTPSVPPVFNFEFRAPRPWVIATGPDGTLWTSGYDPQIASNYIGHVALDGHLTEYPFVQVTDLAAGPDGNVWFVLPSTIGRITPSGQITTFHLKSADGEDFPNGITAGPDGNLWFTDTGYIGRITPSGAITRFPDLDLGDPGRITAGPDGELWFTEGGAVARISTAGVFGGPYAVTGLTSGYPDDIAPVPCGQRLAFTFQTSAFGTVTTTGAVTLFPAPADALLRGIAPGAAGTVWVADSGRSEVGRITGLQGPVAVCVPLAPRVFVTPLAHDHLGGTIGWMNQWPGTHGVTDATGLGLFGTPRGIPIGRTYTHRFDAAGTYPYDDPFHPATAGRVNVPVRLALVPGATGTAQVTWADAAPARGLAFDAQVEPPGASGFQAWRSGTVAESAVFGPGDPLYAGPGTYRFRARLRDLANGAAAGYSGAATITLR